MDVANRIETTRFLGAEFLLWLWFAGELLDGKLDAGPHGVVEISLEAQLSLTDLLSPRETISMRGSDPFSSAEADQALKNGKLPSRALLRLKQGDSEWLVTLDAFSLALSGVKLPGYEASDDEQLFERMSLLEQLDEIVHEVYRQFLLLRLAPSWQERFFPALRAWIAGKVTLDERTARKLLAAAVGRKAAAGARGAGREGARRHRDRSKAGAT